MFVDTPGLVDGDMLYPFDVNKSIEWLGTFQVCGCILKFDRWAGMELNYLFCNCESFLPTIVKAEGQ